MKTVYKYPLAMREFQYVALPIGAQILCVQPQRDQVCIWALVETSNDIEQRAIIIYGTGHPISEDTTGSYIGTFQIEDGALVFHAFEGRQS